MSRIETLNPFYKNFINKKIDELPLNINYIYGGQTEKKLEERQKQHEKENNIFCKMNIEKIFCSSTETQVKQINLAETYLIQTLHKKFGEKCLNRTDFGGGGQHHNEGDEHKIYVMYK
jgi:hypothetical protein